MNPEDLVLSDQARHRGTPAAGCPLEAASEKQRAGWRLHGQEEGGRGELLVWEPEVSAVQDE